MTAMTTDYAPVTTKVVDDGITNVTIALQSIWNGWMVEFDLPAATVVIQRDARNWGHFTLWKPWGEQKVSKKGDAKFADAHHEVMISGEALARGPVAVFGTLMHEAAHARNYKAGVRDCDKGGRHNKKFKATAESMGLCIEDAGSRGWTNTSVPEATVKARAFEINTIAAALAHSSVAQKGANGAAGSKPKSPNRNLLAASCPCGLKLRASAAVLRSGVLCADCGEEFAPAA